MIRSVIFLLIFGVTTTLSFSQRIDYNKIILPDDIDSISFPEKLVRLAWQNNPSNKILQHEVDINQYQIAKSKWSWTERVTAVLNVNEFTVKEGISQNNTFYPRYNFGIAISLGTFITAPIETKINKQKLLISNEQINAQKLALRAEVLSLYETYKMTQQLLQVQSELTEDEYSKYLLAEQQFKAGEINIEFYNTTFKAYNTELIKRIELERDLVISKLQLEKIVGVTLEDVW